MLNYTLDDFAASEDPADLAIICNIAYKTMLALYGDLLVLHGRHDLAAAERANQAMIEKARAHIREILASLPDSLVLSDAGDLLSAHLRAMLLDAEREMRARVTQET